MPGTAAGDTVGLTFNITAARIVTMDTTSRTMGTLNIGDSGSSYFAYTLAASGGASLTFNNSGSTAKLVQNVTTAADVISLPITLADNLSVSNNSALTLSGVISGAKSITKSGAGSLTLSGANTFSGGLTLSNGTLVISHVNALGTGTLTLAGGMIISGDFMFTNNVVVTGNAAYENTADNTDPGHPGDLSGGGTLTNVSTVSSWKWAGDISGFTGTIIDNSTANMIFRGSTSVSRDGSNARWVLNSAAFSLGLTTSGTFKMGELSGSGKITGSYNTAAIMTYEVGALNTSSTFSGTFVDGGGTTIGRCAMIKVGTGTLTLSGSNTYTGGTLLSAGTLNLGASNVLPNSGALIMNGGTFANSGYNDTQGALTLQASSAMTLGTNTGSVTFASGSHTAGTLTISNWTGTAGVSGTANKIFITAAPSATFLTNITFAGYQNGAIRLGTGEIVPSGSLPTKLAITSVNGGSNPTIGAAFSVVVQAQNASGSAANVASNTAVTLSLNTGAGTLGGTLTVTITNGTSSVTISGVTYSKAESGVVLTATRTSGDSLTAGNCSSFTVNPATVTISSGLTADNKIYSGTTAATISSNSVVLSGVLAGDVANVKLSTNGYTATFATAAVGSGKTVTVSGLTLTGSAAGNYTLTQPSLSANITPVTVTVSSGLTANNKIYNGTTAATISSNTVVLSGVLAGDAANVKLSTNGYTANFATATVGSGKTVTMSGLTLTGSAAANYTLTQPSLTANITVATVTVSSGLTANNKAYDGTTTATISSNNVVFSGVIAGDTANVKLSTNGYAASFATAALGSGKTVTVSGLTLTGSAAANYTLTQPSLSANITVATVTVLSGLTANTKVFDSTTAATIRSNNVVLSGVFAGDAANVKLSTNGYTASFANALAGSGKTVTVSGLTLTGSAAGSYTLTQPSLMADITEADWFNPAWTNRLAITIDHTKVSSTLTNFPVLINLTNSSLQQYAQSDGDDILFTAADAVTKLAHEIESYTSTNGALVAWVNVPIVSSSVDTVIYLYYRNTTTTNQQNATAVWDSNFKSVWHLQDNSTATPAPLYQWTFDNGDGVPVITAGGGTLAVRNIIGTGSIAFRSTNGVSQGVLDASANGYSTNSAVALATNLSGLGTLNQFTVTFWVKLPDPESGFPRLVGFAANSGYDNGGKSSTVSNGFGVNLHGGNLQPGFGSTNKYFSNTSLTGFGSVLASNTWIFVSLLYDGTSALASNSPAMSTATGGLATNNMATFLGTLTDPVSFDAQTGITPNSISDFTSNLGPISFGNNATVLMGNHTNGPNARGLAGLLDDVRIYNTVLTPAQLEAIRLSGVPNITDSTINAHGGTGTNMLSDDAQLAKIAGGMDFDGATNQYIQTTSSESKTADSLTWECWFKAGSTTFARHLLWQGTNTADGWGSATTNEPSMNLSLGDYTGSGVNNQLSFFFGDTDTSHSSGVIDAAVAFSDTNAWHHAAAVVTNISSAPGATLYLDGVAVASDTGITARTVRAAWNRNLRLGAAGDGSKNYLGLLDEVRVSDINRSAAWIAAEFNNQSSPSTFYNIVGGQSSPTVKLAITAVNDGFNPVAGTAFAIEVEAQDTGGNPRNVTTETVVTLSLTNGSGTLGGTLTGTIGVGCNSVTISGVTYTKAESGVIVTATRTSGMVLTPTNSAAFTVVPGDVHHFSFAAIATQTYAAAFNVTITAWDSNNNTATNFTGTADLTTTAGTISPAVSSAFSSGVRIQSVAVALAGSGMTITATKTGGSETGTSASFNVNQVPLTVTANNTSRVYGAANPSFTASYSGFVNGDNSSVVQGAPGFSTSATTGSAVGGYAITPSLGTLTATNYSLTTFNDGTVTIGKAGTANAVSTSANPSPTGSNVIFTATLTAVAPGSGTPTGTVQFKSDGAALGSPVTLAGGTANLTNSSLSHGTHTITAEYAGDSNFIGSTNALSPDQVVNTSPTAANDTVARYTSSGAKVRVTTLLANDTDADADALTFTSFSATSAQGVTVSSNGAWMFYTPPEGFTDADSFSYVITDSGGLLSTGLVAITIVANLNQSQNVLATDDLGNGDFRTRFLGIPNRTYTIQFTTNLVTPDWQALGTAAASVTGAFEFTDTPPPASPVRFYRSVYP